MSVIFVILDCIPRFKIRLVYLDARPGYAALYYDDGRAHQEAQISLIKRLEFAKIAESQLNRQIRLDLP